MGNISDLLTVVLGFSAIIFVHELGHFVVARWAGVRVLAFALGFGPALVSYRKGIGVRTGTSEPAYRKMAREQGDGRGLVPGVSPTEYRLNVFPLGGYVKMLGQDDADPSHRSEQPDSYNSVSIPQRMAIHSAGVVKSLRPAAWVFGGGVAVGLLAESALVWPFAAG
ncbi:MAG: site-2 protease family protein, partial [bacterium]